MVRPLVCLGTLANSMAQKGRELTCEAYHIHLCRGSQRTVPAGRTLILVTCVTTIRVAAARTARSDRAARSVPYALTLRFGYHRKLPHLQNAGGPPLL